MSCRYVDDVFGYDFVEDDGDPMDTNGHGTHIAGILGAVAANGRGIAGVVPRVRMMALRVMGEGTTGRGSGERCCDVQRELHALCSRRPTCSCLTWAPVRLGP